MHCNNGSVPRYHNHQNRHSCPPPSIPPPPSAANSLRSSAPMSLRSAGNSTLFRHSIAMDSIPLADPIVANDDRHLVMTNEILKDKSQVLDNEIIETKVSANILPIFILESLSLICLSSLAYFLRFTDSFGVLIKGFYCDDKSISLPFRPQFGQNSKPVMTGFSDEVFYCITIGVPVLMISLSEIIRMFVRSGHKRKKVIAAQTGCMTCTIHMAFRRIFRFIGGFAYGMLITSILTDTLKLISGRLRPYFLNVCPIISEICKRLSIENTDIDYESKAFIDFKHIWVNPNDFDDFILCHNQTERIREARMSFPSSTASIATYSAVFMLLYVCSVITFRSGRIIRLWFNVSTLICLLIVIFGKVSTHDNHMEDVIIGLCIGTGFALYICYTQLNRFKDQTIERKNESFESESQLSLTEEEENAWFWKYFHIPRVNLLRRSARYFRRRDDNTIPPVVRCSNGSAYVNPAFDHKNIIENSGTRSHSGYNDGYRH